MASIDPTRIALNRSADVGLKYLGAVEDARRAKMV